MTDQRYPGGEEMHAPEIPADIKQLVRVRRVCFGVLVVMAAVVGIRAAAIPEADNRGPGALLAPVLLAVATATWCQFDGRVRGKPPAPVGLMGIFLAPPIGLPVYCIWSRGLRGILFGLGLIGLLAGVWLLAGFAADSALRSR